VYNKLKVQVKSGVIFVQWSISYPISLTLDEQYASVAPLSHRRHRNRVVVADNIGS
jgi:hypothetical protein